MPPVHVSTQIGSTMVSLLQQSANMQQGLGNALQQNYLGNYHKERADAAAKTGERMIDRMTFWATLAIPVISPWVVLRLTDKLDRASDEIERWIALGVR